MEDDGAPEDGDARDRALVAAHLDGDRDAFATLVRTHQDRLWAVAVRTLGDRDEAADALQDALLSAYRAAASYQGNARVTTWLHRVVVNACLDRARRRAARPTVPLPDRYDVPAPATRWTTARRRSSWRPPWPRCHPSSAPPSCWWTCRGTASTRPRACSAAHRAR